MMQDPFKNYSHLHFIGIGGIGISALAMILQSFGHKISGSDQNKSKITENLSKEGIKISLGHQAENVAINTDLVIFSTAIDKNNIELLTAQERKIKTLTYPEAIGFLTQKLSTIAICGTHGKTTTTALISSALIQNNFDPTVIVGALIPELSQKNFKIGNSQYLILESCEYQRAFLNYQPKIIILTNIELDHLDYYKDLSDYLSSYEEFIKKLPSDGLLIANIDDQNIQKVVKKFPQLNIISFGKSENADYQIKPDGIYKQNSLIKKLNLKIPGLHNIYNATAAFVLSDYFKLNQAISILALENYQGSSRRFEIKGQIDKTLIIDDYAHHPTEIETTLTAAREKYGNSAKILCIFQPHQYSRTIKLLDQFIDCFKNADQVIIPNIYQARDSEEDIKKISVDTLVDAINRKHHKKAINGQSFHETLEYLKNNFQNYDIVFTMGAGNIYEIADSFLKDQK